VHRHWEASRQWTRRDAAVKRLEQQRRDQTKQFRCSLGNALVRAFDAVGIGDYAPSATDHNLGRTRKRKAKSNRAINTRSQIGLFKTDLLWIAKRSGKAAFVVDEAGTTRTCSHCGHVVDGSHRMSWHKDGRPRTGGIPPHVRAWTCPACGTGHIRDENASKNGLSRLLSHLGIGLVGNFHVPRSGPAGFSVATRCDWRFQPKGWWEVPRDPPDAPPMRIKSGSPNRRAAEAKATRRDCPRPSCAKPTGQSAGHKIAQV